MTSAPSILCGWDIPIMQMGKLRLREDTQAELEPWAQTFLGS